MEICRNCGNQVNDGTKFCPKCGQPINGSLQPQQPVYQQPQQQVYQQSTQAYQTQQQQPLKPDSHMVLAILSTIFCCLPIGVYAIVLANKVDKLYYSGQYDEAEEASQGAKKWSIIGAAAYAIIWFVMILCMLFLPGFAEGFAEGFAGGL